MAQQTTNVLSPQQYIAARLKSFEDAQKEDKNFHAYPHKFQPTITLSEFMNKFGGLQTNDKLSDSVVSLAGRLMSKRSSGNNLYFYDLKAEGGKIQVLSNKVDYKGSWDVHNLLHRGDLVGIVGFPGKSKTGELSIFPHTLQLLSPCLHYLPTDWYGLKDQETRFRQRYLDLILNDNVRNKFIVRTKIVKYVRNFLDSRNFMEVETPMLNMVAGGASAKPFTTHHNDLNMELFMRIAPELFLKQCVIGGLDRVYELGKSFRNEGIDQRHNPEFTTCEAYAAYFDYHDWMKMTEEMISGMVKEITGDYKITFHPEGSDKQGKVIDFTPPWRRIPMIAGLEEATGEKFPADLTSPEAHQFLVRMIEKHNVKCNPPQTIARLLDKLAERFLEVQCTNPTFLIDHPEVMSPLAKGHRSTPGLTERFELFVDGMELCNSYTELNDPIVQRDRFMSQEKERQTSNDEEAQRLDEPFCVALEYGLPPTGGWGFGIDRMTMFLSDSYTIKEVILFPAMKPLDAVPATEEPSNKNPAPQPEKQQVKQPVASTSAPSGPAVLSEALYLADSYAFEGKAVVLDVRTQGPDVVIILDKTVFHPQGGGQPTDTGSLELYDSGEKATFAVSSVARTPNGELLHKGSFKEGKLKVGDKVAMKVDSDKRMLHTKFHSAGHLLDDAARSLSYKWKNTKSHHFPADAFISYDSADPVDAEKVKKELEAELNKMIAEATPVDVQSVPYDQVRNVCGEEPPAFFPKDQPVRVVRVRGSNGVALPCVGTHVKSLKDIGSVKISKVKVKNNKSVSVFYEVK